MGKFKVFLVVGLLFFSLSCMSQGGCVWGAAIPSHPGKVYLYNKTNVGIKYNASRDCVNWTAKSIDSKQTLIFNSNFYIDLWTGDDNVRYLLEKGGNYFFIWDDESQSYLIRKKPEE